MSEPSSPNRDRFAPHAAREMADMFDDVSDRYDLLNALLTLGRDAAWRAEMAAEVPDDARVVLDLCTGSGTSLDGLREPGRVVLGVDVSVRMLRQARERHGRGGWAPQLVAADGFHLPFAAASVDCVTVAFGLRNLRPRAQALAEIGRVLRPGGTLIVLEGVAPAGGPLAGAHRFYLRRVVPFVGRLSADPTAYRYLGESILDFGPGEEFERDLAAAAFRLDRRRVFLFGATRLWTARRAGDGHTEAVHAARLGESTRGRMPTRAAARAAEWRRWNGVQLAVSASILAGLLYALVAFLNSSGDMPLAPWHRRAMTTLLLAGVAGFALRTIVLAFRIVGPPPRF
jgi:demethylmenaquinone methyltransferase/2-methoxy-6-polyprenyl-1,4-benzoquinol methylase